MKRKIIHSLIVSLGLLGGLGLGHLMLTYPEAFGLIPRPWPPSKEVAVYLVYLTSLGAYLVALFQVWGRREK